MKRSRLGGGSWTRGRLFRLFPKEERQIGLRDAHGLGDLNHDALVEVELIALVKLVGVFVVGVAEEVARLVVHHDAVVEGVEFEIAILPPLLLASDIVGEETAVLGDGRRVLRGGDGGGVRCTSNRGRHHVRRWRRRVVWAAQDMGASGTAEVVRLDVEVQGDVEV